jgi:hypothetical protein
MMQIRVYDGRTFELIGEAPANNDNESRLERAFHNPVGGPFRKLDAAEFPAEPSDTYPAIPCCATACAPY